MDLGSPDKSIEEIKKEDGASVVGELDQNLFKRKDEQGEDSFGHGNKAMNGIMQVDSNQDQFGPPMLPVGVDNDGFQSSNLKSNSPVLSPPSKRTEEHCLQVESDLYYTDADKKFSNYNSEGLRPPIDDYATHSKREGTDYVGLSDGPPMLLVGVDNEGFQSSILESNSPGPSPPLKRTEEHCLPIESDQYLTDVDSKISNHNYEGLRSPIDDYVTYSKREGTEYVGLSDEPLDSSVNEAFNNKMETEDLDPCTHHPLLKVGDKNAYEVVDNEVSSHESAKSPFNEPVNGDSGKLPGNTQSVKAEFVMEERDDRDCSHHTETKEDLVPSDNGVFEWQNSGQHSPQKTRNTTPLPERQLSVSPERSSQTQPVAREKKLSSPANSDRKAEPSRGPSKRKRTLSPEKHSVGRKRATSHDRLSPSGRRQSPSDRTAQRDSHHRDNSPRRRLSASPRRRESPRRRDRSASRSPVRRRDSSGYRREQRGRSRSRSPYARDRYQRSPRRRHSPRRRSPPSSYHSRRRSPRRARSPLANRKNGLGRPGNNLFIAGFSYVTTERDLEKKFSKYGRVTDVRIVREKRSGDSRGFGFLSLEKDEDADAAIRALDQTEWNGRIILVEKSKTSLR